jgi:hypothetical protein
VDHCACILLSLLRAGGVAAVGEGPNGERLQEGGAGLGAPTADCGEESDWDELKRAATANGASEREEQVGGRRQVKSWTFFRRVQAAWHQRKLIQNASG